MSKEAEASPDEELSFEQILSKLEHVVAGLSRGDAPLEQAVALFEQGVRLSRLGAARLDEAERRIELLLTNGDEVRTRPLPDAALASEGSTHVAREVSDHER